MARTRHHGDKAKQRKFGSIWHWYQSTPSAWNREFHTKPKRAENRRLIHRTLRGDHEQVWPLGNHKPHVYYW
jgi:hypothetical protein